MLTIKRNEAKRLIRQSKGFFTVIFERRHPKKMPDGTISFTRKMQCMLNVKKHLKGGRLNYDPNAYDLQIVCDIGACRNDEPSKYKAIPLDGLTHLNINKKRYTVVD